MDYFKNKKLFKLSVIGIICLLYFTNPVFSQTKAQVYSTWDTLEVDTCATAWLIKNFVDKNAVFRFYPKGDIITEGIAFDTPDAEFRRTNSFSAFETVLNKYKLDDPALKQIGEMIHEIEINFWAHDSNSNILEFNQKVLSEVKKAATTDEGLKNALLVFDELYAGLANKQ